MSIRNQIQASMVVAMKSRDAQRLGSVRYVFAQIKNKEIDLKRELNDDETLKLLRTEAKRRKDAVDAYEKGGRKDLVEKEQFDLSIIEEYLPKQLSDEDIKVIIDEVKKTSQNTDFGLLMKSVMAKVSGRADGGRVSSLLRS